MSTNLSIPKELTALIELGFWPKDYDEARKQNLNCLLPESAIRSFAPEERRIFLLPPPFHTVRQVMESEKTFWADPRIAVQEIDPDLLFSSETLDSDQMLLWRWIIGLRLPNRVS